MGKTVAAYFLGLLVAGGCAGKDPRFMQYYAEGEQLYVKHCSNCHQKDGTGLGLLYPPLDVSDFIDQRQSEVICIMKFGKRGELLVNGKSYNQPMPAVVSLTELEIAEIMTYLNNNWGRERGIFAVQEVGKILSTCDKD